MLWKNGTFRGCPSGAPCFRVQIEPEDARRLLLIFFCLDEGRVRTCHGFVLPCQGRILLCPAWAGSL